MEEEDRKQILELHNKGLSIFYIEMKLRIPQGIIMQVLDDEIKKDMFV